MRPLPLAASALVFALAACAPAAVADRSAVEAAQSAWCDALAKMSGASGSWEQMAACKAAYPTGSAAYLRGMTKCFPARKAAYGDKPTDSGHLEAECKEEVMFKLNVDDSAYQEALDAHCERALRCEKTPITDCVAGVKKLESSQRALAYGIYNGTALHAVAGCLRDSACGADEDAAQQSCYKPVEGKLLWFP